MESAELYNEQVPFDAILGELDIRQLQVAFSDLFDKTAEALQKLGLDQDDIVLDRFLLIQTTEGPGEFPAEWLSEKARLIAGIESHFLARFRSGDRPSTALCVDTWRVIALRVVVRSAALPVREFPIL